MPPYSSQGKSSPLTYSQDPTWCVLDHHFDLISHRWPSHSLCPGHVGQTCFVSLPGMPLLRAASFSPFPFQLGYNFLTQPGKVVRFGQVTLVTKLLSVLLPLSSYQMSFLLLFFHFVPLLETLLELTRQWKLGQSRYRVRDAGVDNMLTSLLVTRKTSKHFCNNKYGEGKFNAN